MRTATIQVYNFSELSETAKEKAISNYIENLYDWWDSIYDYWNDKLTEIGFNNVKIYFSGFYSQGNGAMFTYKHIDEKLYNEYIESTELTPLRKKWAKGIIESIYAKGEQRGHYYHEKSCNHLVELETTFDWYAYLNLSDWVNDLNVGFQEYLTDLYEELCSDIYKDLKEEYEYLTSEEGVRENSEANEYEFHSDGSMY